MLRDSTSLWILNYSTIQHTHNTIYSIVLVVVTFYYYYLIYYCISLYLSISISCCYSQHSYLHFIPSVYNNDGDLGTRTQVYICVSFPLPIYNHIVIITIMCLCVCVCTSKERDGYNTHPLGKRNGVVYPPHFYPLERERRINMYMSFPSLERWFLCVCVWIYFSR